MTKYITIYALRDYFESRAGYLGYYIIPTAKVMLALCVPSKKSYTISMPIHLPRRMGESTKNKLLVKLLLQEIKKLKYKDPTDEIFFFCLIHHFSLGKNALRSKK